MDELPEPIAARYVGAGAFLQGMPARDVTVAEWEALTEDQRALGVALGLYVLA